MITLADTPAFAGVSRIDEVSSCASATSFRAGERILTENEPADRFYIIESGGAAIEVHDAQRGPLVIETVGPTEVLGVSWLLPPHRFTFDARAVAPTEALHIDAACLRAKCDADPELGYELYRAFSGLIRNRLQAARLQLLDLYGGDRG